MQIKLKKINTIDGVRQKVAPTSPNKRLVQKKVVSAAKVVQPRYRAPYVSSRTVVASKPFYSIKWPPQNLLKQLWAQIKTFPTASRLATSLVIVVVVSLAFAGGINFELNTPRSQAENKAAEQSMPAGTVVNLVQAPASASANELSNAVIFNTPLQDLQKYFEDSSSSVDSLADRKVKLKQFLSQHDSPLLDQSDVIAEQAHWQLILAISFAESTLGKKCYMFNCSGIGGANIKTYSSFAGWILDFNRLLDKRYNNWTLDEMCGVYVKPCTNNWLNATKQILEELQQLDIH